jgi:hypothetical protein
MNKIKNSFALGILIGLTFSMILLVILDAVVYFIYQSSGKRNIEVDVCFALCTMVNLFFARKFFRQEEKQELGKGFLFAAFIWGAAYVYLFHISPIKTLFFVS